MPYVIAFLMLVVVSVGFTLFQSQDKIALGETEPTTIEAIKETVDSLIATATPSLPIDTEETTLPTVPAEVTATQEIPTPNTGVNPTPVPKPAPAPALAPTVAYDYKNGTYHSQQSYRTPNGQYQMDVGVTLVNDKVTNTTLSFGTGGGDGYSKRFSNSYQSQIVGQDMGTVNLSRVGGASLTTRAFNSALDSIRSQANS